MAPASTGMCTWEALSSLRAARPVPTQEPRPGGKAVVENETSVVMLGPRDRLIGELYIEGNLRVSGTLEGQIEATGDVDVTEAATVKASVAGREVNVSGQVNGAVVASKKLVIGRSGSIVGDVRVPRLIMQDGASLSGNVSMGPKVAAE